MNPSARRTWAAAVGLAVAGATLAASSVAAAAPREQVEFDALGDSYASGIGVPPYGPCGQSEAAYAVQLDGRMKLHLDDFVACSGATTETLVSGGQLEALDEGTDLVTLSIGGNDIGWGTVVGACLLGSDELCAAALAASIGAVTNVLPSKLDAVYADIVDRAPNAHVVVTGYPHLFSPEFGDYLGVSTAEQQALNDGADLLNSVIAEAADCYGMQFVDVTGRFVGHGVNAPAPWILGPGAGAFHPNAKGYQAYTAALTSQINPSGLK